MGRPREGATLYCVHRSSRAMRCERRSWPECIPAIPVCAQKVISSAFTRARAGSAPPRATQYARTAYPRQTRALYRARSRDATLTQFRYWRFFALGFLRRTDGPRPHDRHGDITAPWDAKPHPRMPHRPRMPPGCGRGARSLRHPRIILKIHASQDTPNASQDAVASLRMPSRLPGCAHPETPSPCISGCWHPETPPPPPKMIPALPGMVSPALGARVSQGASIAS